MACKKSECVSCKRDNCVWKPKSNYDKVLSMTIEEFADWITDICNQPMWYSTEMWLDWLKQEATDVSIPQQD